MSRKNKTLAERVAILLNEQTFRSLAVDMDPEKWLYEECTKEGRADALRCAREVIRLVKDSEV